jgi:cell division protein FtsI/penicillin-binding protein 2
LTLSATVVVRGQREDVRRSQRQAEQVVRDYLAAWSRGDSAAAAALTAAGQASAAAALLTRTGAQMRASAASFTLLGNVSVGDRAGGRYQARVDVMGLGRASWTGRVPLVRQAGRWRVQFGPEVLHPALHVGGSLKYERTRGPRGVVRFRDGQLMSRDADLAGNLQGDSARAATAAQALAAGPGNLPGDRLGTSGLERAYNQVLSGQPGGSLTVRDSQDRITATLLTVTAQVGRDLRTSLDARVQRAGELAVAAVRQPGALVALDSLTGQILALVNSPSGGFGRAIAGKGPPGSTFKIITSAAALIAGVPASTVLNCSPTATINGRIFSNAENESFGPITWTEAFAKSCNTWFVQLQQKVPIGTLTSTAQLFGFSTSPDQQGAHTQPDGILPIRSFGGSYPTPLDRAQAAGQSIGQDRVLASPLLMASVAAAVASGSWRQPTVLPAATVTHPLPRAVASTLQTLMAAVVDSGGTAAHAGLPAGTYGKTGTAETSASRINPKLTDSWFVGFRGTTAFAVEFDQAGFGADVAAPAAARFLRALG